MAKRAKWSVKESDLGSGPYDVTLTLMGLDNSKYDLLKSWITKNFKVNLP